MEKSRPEILSEIQETLAGLKTRIAEIERKLAELEQASEEPAHIEVIEEPEPIYVEPPVITAVPEPVEDVVEEEPVQEPQVIENFESSNTDADISEADVVIVIGTNDDIVSNP